MANYEKEIVSWCGNKIVRTTGSVSVGALSCYWTEEVLLGVALRCVFTTEYKKPAIIK
jgi:hypothetical protein